MRGIIRCALLISLLSLSLSACANSASPLLSTDLCKYYRQTTGDVAGGETAPLPIEVEAGKKLSITYVGDFAADQGSATFFLLNDVSDPLWQQKITPSQTPVTLTPDVQLATGNYNVIIAFSDMGKHLICWKVETK
ncbi:MAG: hypothetical protein U0528_18830 [Anaerolineae bacterium]